MKITSKTLIKCKLNWDLINILQIFKNRITMLQESGIYQFETRKSVTPKGFGPEVDTKIPEEFRLEPIVFRVIKGILTFLAIGLGSASVVLIIELIVFIIQKKYLDCLQGLGIGG